MLRRAQREWQWIETVPPIRLHREPEGRVRYLSPQEIDTFLRNLPDHLRAVTRFTFATGLRRGKRWAFQFVRAALTSRGPLLIEECRDAARSRELN